SSQRLFRSAGGPHHAALLHSRRGCKYAHQPRGRERFLNPSALRRYDWHLRTSTTRRKVEADDVSFPRVMNFDVLIIGGGAAGLMCAIEAGKRGRSVLLIEGAERPGKKILISGGGRCNFTNLHCKPDNFLSSN